MLLVSLKLASSILCQKESLPRGKNNSMNLTVILSSVLLCSVLSAQSAAPASKDLTKKNLISSPASTRISQTPSRSRYLPERLAGRAGTYYRLIWGIEGLSVKWAEQGELIRFSYTIVDPAKAKMLNDKKLEPSLIDERAHVKLVVPMMDKVGLLRQTGDPEAGKTYWMLFSNKGGYVKRGDRVRVVIGKFQADGLIID